MRPLGILIIAAATAAPLYWFLPLAAKGDGVAIFSQYLGASALVVMGISQLLATRLRGLESLFGGLDRIYVLHKWLGIGAMALILLHDTIDAELEGRRRETLLSETAETFGEISLYGLLILVVITVSTFIPYHLWRWTHRFMGAFFALSAFHFLFIAKAFETGTPLGLYISAFCLIGILSYLYTLAPRGWLKGARRYRVEAAEKTGDALAVTMAPVGRGLRHRAGQFAFLGLELPGFGEVHPFTISKAPSRDRSLRFTIKALGDYTEQLADRLQPGNEAKVTGPYGAFLHKGGRGPEIWIAGGIGITPFLAWMQELGDKDGPVHLFYCVRERTRAPHLEELEAFQLHHPNFHLHLTESAKESRLTAARIAETIDSPLSEARAAFCGPEAMRKALRAELAAAGLRPSRFRYEEFEIRSGIGLQRLLMWLFARLFGFVTAGRAKGTSEA